MPQSKSGRTALKNRIKQCRRHVQRILELLQDADTINQGANPVVEAMIPVAVSITVNLGQVFDKANKAT